MRMTAVMLLHLAGPASAAHAQVFDGTAEACHLVALEMAQHDDDIRVIQGAADIGLPAELTIGHRDADIIRALQAVGNDVVAAGGHIVEPVDIRIQQMVHRGYQPIQYRERDLDDRLSQWKPCDLSVVDGSTAFTANPYVEYYFWESGPVSFFVEGGLALTWNKGFSYNPYVAPGISFAISDHWSVLGHIGRLGYDSLTQSLQFSISKAASLGLGLYYSF